MKLKHILKKEIPSSKLEKISKSFDLIGSKEKAVAIIEIPKMLSKYEKIIAKAIIKQNKNIKSVLKKTSERKGKLRLRRLKLIFGDKNTEVMHKEYGYYLKLDPIKVYFSPREATERNRLASLVKKNESILVLFSGISPIPIAIIKKQPNVKEIVAIELNKIAHKYAKENIKLNKTNKIKLIQGDVKKILPKLNKKFSRIIMPLPKNSQNYLNLTDKVSKKTTIIHLYRFLTEEEIKNIKIKNYKILNKIKCGRYSPKLFRVCLEIKLVS